MRNVGPTMGTTERNEMKTLLLEIKAKLNIWLWRRFGIDVFGPKAARDD